MSLDILHNSHLASTASGPLSGTSNKMASYKVLQQRRATEEIHTYLIFDLK
jgi:hypothetical protein